MSKLFCKKCGESWGTNRLSGRYFCLDNEVQHILFSQAAWCPDCKSYVPMEEFLAERMRSKINSIKHIVKSLPVELLSAERPHSFFKAPQNDFTQAFHRLSKIEDDMWEIELFLDRGSQPRCLECGSYDAKPFDGDYSSRSLPQPNENMPNPQKFTGTHHPECGGEIWLEEDAVRIHFYNHVNNFQTDRLGNRIP